MASLFGVVTGRKWMLVGLVCFATTFGPLGGALRCDEAKKSRVLPPPIQRIEERAFRSLEQPTTVDFIDLPVSDAVQFLAEYHNLSIRIDDAALREARISLDAPTTLKLNGVPFQRIVNLLLEPRGLGWYIEGSGLIVTTRAATTAPVRKWLEQLLEPELQIVDHLCELTDAQRRKLQVAGRGEIRRLLDGIEERELKLQLLKDDDEKTDKLYHEIEQLQRSVQFGPFGKGSLFRKALEVTLSAEQMVKYDPIRAVLQAGGLVGTLQRGPDVVLGVVLIQTAFTDEGMARLKGLTDLGSLRLDVTRVTDAGLVHLPGLTNLRVLSLSNTQTSDVGLDHLNKLTNLQELVLSGSQVTDRGLVRLKDLANLRTLGLDATQVTDDGLIHLQVLKKLQVLGLSSTQVTDAGLAHLKGLPDLQELYLAGAPVTDAGLAHLEGLPNLQDLDLFGAQVTDAGLAQLKGMPNLYTLNLGKTKVTGDGLRHLKVLPRLRMLYLSQTTVTDAGVAELQRVMPKTHIVK
jgi:hypothetical protein